MFLMPEDLQAIVDLLNDRADLDPRLLGRCSEHVEKGQYEDAVFKAFIVLEERLQQRSGIKDVGGVKLLGQALSQNGSLTKRVGLSKSDADNLKLLLLGAFGLFRNPGAHPGEPLIEYGPVECQTLLAFVTG